MANRLINEKSPYLLQHAHNPVDWYPWGEAAFKTAQENQKPVFLSIGYSTCHWCHVMEAESFSATDVAELLNRDFISIKVDREERPDIDAIYMSICQMLTGRGGWPMTIIMTPDKKPFYAATYIPRTSHHETGGMLQLLPAIAKIWQNKRKEIEESAEQIYNIIKEAAIPESGEIQTVENIINAGFDEINRLYDPENGGFGTAPKFPTPHSLLYLLHYSWRYNCKPALAMVEKTLQQMRHGGIYDHIGGGFHRYSTDAQWHVPHFEKMLYDQAYMIHAYLTAFEITGNELYADTAREIINYILRDMRSADGRFYSGEDADSDGSEGRFYLWTIAELQSALTAAEFKIVNDCFDIAESGNYQDELNQVTTGENILRLHKDAPTIFPAAIREKLFKLREQRVRPFKDTKILTDWNGLMAGALAHAGRTLGEIQYIEAARQAIDPILNDAVTNQYRISHCHNGNAAVPGMLDDYAFVIAALLELYQATHELAWLKQAEKLCDCVNKYFTAAGKYCYYMTASDAEQLLIRPQEIHDGAMPSGNSTMLHNNLKMAYYSGNSHYDEIAAGMIDEMSAKINQNPAAHLHTIAGLISYNTPHTELILVTLDKNDRQTKTILDYADTCYNPSLHLLLKTPENRIELAQFAPFTEPAESIEGKTTAYFCHNKSCMLPLNSTREIKQQLKISQNQFTPIRSH